MDFPFKTAREKAIAVALIGLWVLLYLPHLRTSPNWYGDEGEWMDKCWTFIHGTPRVGPITNDFVFPYPYPPLYMLINGALLRVFGNDILVGRALGAVTALAAAVILFWIGTRVRDKSFGFLCAAAFLVYEQADVNFRWVRSHPMTGTLALASAGFLICYLQNQRLKDLVWAGVMCSVATATNYYAVGMIPAVIVAAIWVNARRLREMGAWRDIVIGAATAGAYGTIFVLWYLATKGGLQHLQEQLHRLGAMTSQPASLPEVFARVVRFVFMTPTRVGPTGLEGHDWWLMAAAAGLIAFPVARLRVWLVLWVLLLMYPVFRKQDNVSMFFYPATIFLPLMAMGVAGAAEQAGRLLAWAVGKKQSRDLWLLPGVIACALWGFVTLQGSMGHFNTMIDAFSQRSVPEAEAALRYVNDHAGTDGFIMLPKQIFWLVKGERKSMLSHCVTIEGLTNDAWPVPIPREFFWFDCGWQNAQYLVLASGITRGGQPRGIDLIYTRGLKGVQDVIDGVLGEKWPVVYTGGEQVAVVSVGGGKSWPVAVEGEYIVFGNPRFVKGTQPAQ